MSFFQNTCKPKGLGGSLMVNMMNIGHSPMAEWGLKHIKINKNDISLDVGCGGGANIKKLLEKSPKGKVFGIDYSEVSVRKSKKVNKTVSCHILLPPVTGILFLQPRNRLLLFRQRKQTDSEENSVLFSSVS